MGELRRRFRRDCGVRHVVRERIAWLEELRGAEVGDAAGPDGSDARSQRRVLDATTLGVKRAAANWQTASEELHRVRRGRCGRRGSRKRVAWLEELRGASLQRRVLDAKILDVKKAPARWKTAGEELRRHARRGCGVRRAALRERVAWLEELRGARLQRRVLDATTLDVKRVEVLRLGVAFVGETRRMEEEASDFVQLATARLAVVRDGVRVGTPGRSRHRWVAAHLFYHRIQSIIFGQELRRTAARR